MSRARISIETLTKATPFEDVLPLIMPMIKRISRDTNGVYGLEHEDLEQELCLQAFNSWQKWDPNEGTKFSTYVYNALMKQKNFLVRSAKAQRRNSGIQPISLDGLRDSDSCSNDMKPFRLYDIIEDDSVDLETHVYLLEVKEIIAEVIESLPARAQEIVKMLLEGNTQVEVSQETGYAQSLISYHLSSFRMKLREEFELRGFDIPVAQN